MGFEVDLTSWGEEILNPPGGDEFRCFVPRPTQKCTIHPLDESRFIGYDISNRRIVKEWIGGHHQHRPTGPISQGFQQCAPSHEVFGDATNSVLLGNVEHRAESAEIEHSGNDGGRVRDDDAPLALLGALLRLDQNT